MKTAALILPLLLLLGGAASGVIDDNLRPAEIVKNDHAASSSSSSSSSSADASVISAAKSNSSSSSSSESDSSSEADSASSSSSSSSADSSSNQDFGYLRKFHLFLEGVSRTEKKQQLRELSCPKGRYQKAGDCLPCTRCGPDLYVREQCQPDSDTVCDWCLSARALKNDDYQLKCFEVAKLHREFGQLLRHPHQQREQEVAVVFAEKDPAPYVSYTAIREPFSLSKVSLQNAWKLEMLVEACFYLVLIALVVAVIRFLSKRKPHYRTVTVSSPVLDDTDSKNIIRAAEQIRQKIGKKGYNHLEEFI